MACLDTTLLIDFLKDRNEAIGVIERLEESGEDIMIATPSIIELIRGLETRYATKNEKEKIYELIDSFFILDLDKTGAIKAGEIEGDLIKNGQRIEIEDIMIASIAITNHEKLITRNEKHFRRIKGLEVEVY